MFEWDEKKSEECRKARGFDFSIVFNFDFDTAKIFVDDRENYGETRYRAFNKIANAVYNVVFTVRGTNYRIISVRRVHAKESKKYGF